MTLMSGAQMLVRTLEDLGVEYLFGYPGGAVLDIYDALLDSHKLHHVLGRHEQGLAMAADGYARTTGKVGVCLVTSGPGSTNTVTAIATAYMDSIPLVVITGQVGTQLIGSDAFQEVDTIGITRPVVKHSYLCQKATDIPKYIRQAFYLASTGRPGPVVVDVPKDCVRPSQKFEYPEPEEVHLRSYDPTLQGHKGQIKRITKVLAEAKRPVLMLGGGTIASNASEQIRELAHQFRLPVVSTLMGLGVYSGDDPQFLGMVGMHGTYEANQAMDKADLVLALGVRFDDRVTNNLGKFCPEAAIVHVDIDPASISKTVRTDYPVVGDVSRVLTQLKNSIEELKVGCDNQAMDAWWAQIEEWRGEQSLNFEHKSAVIEPQEIVQTLSELTRGEAVITTDVGQHQMFTAQYYKFTKPRRFLTSGGLGTMGYGFPAGIGAYLGVKDQRLPVCVLTGDGSFQMNIQELSTCLEFQIPLKIFIFDNSTLGNVRQWQRMFYRGRISSTDLKFNPDFVALAKAYGHEAFRIEKPEELRAGIQRALDIKDKLVLVDIVCDTDALIMPMQKGGGRMSEMVLRSDGNTY
ncbi:MAG: biosynthetic-type acetolactate synthase large subunit [Succinivibrio sp.]|nr:biosynthetic-type acetolactate synthase large subunit [Succinivibrio sp.]